jgi:hypothetical protein
MKHFAEKKTTSQKEKWAFAEKNIIFVRVCGSFFTTPSHFFLQSMP